MTVLDWWHSVYRFLSILLECLSTEFGLWTPMGLSQREVIMRRWSEPGDHEAQSIDMGLSLTIIAHLNCPGPRCCVVSHYYACACRCASREEVTRARFAHRARTRAAHLSSARPLFLV